MLRARIALHTEFFPPPLSCKGAFSGVVGSLVEDCIAIRPIY